MKQRARKPRSASRTKAAKKSTPHMLEDQYQRYFGPDEHGASTLPDPAENEPPRLYEIRQFATYGAYEDPI